MDNVDFDGDLPQNINRDSTSKRPNTVQLQTVSNNKILNSSSKTEKLATKSGNEEKFDYFSILPNEIIVKIFEYFDLKTLARTAQVCSRFNDIVTKTDQFYYNLDFQPYWMSADVFDRFMDKTKNLKKLRFNWPNEFPNDSKLEEFLDGAKNTLTHLYIDGRDHTTLNVTLNNERLIKAIFDCKELLELHFINMDLTLHSNGKWFNADIIQCKNLQKLDLTKSHINDRALITILSKTRKLKHLILDHQFLNSSAFMDKILEKLVEFDINLVTWKSLGSNFECRTLSLFQFHTNLEELDLGVCFSPDLTPGSTFNFLAKCSRLKRLSLAGWKSIKDKHLVTVIENCKKLEQVNISILDLVTANSIKELLKLENLKLLDISYCKHETISLFQIEEWRKEHPHVQIRSHLK